MENTYSNCQSCGIPLKNDSKNDQRADRNTDYTCCNDCYENSKFTRTEMMEMDVQEFVKRLCVLEFM